MGLLELLGRSGQSDGIERARARREEALSIGLLPDDWDGESPLALCELCHAFNHEGFGHCRICAERLPRSTLRPEDCRRIALQRSRH
ncbi:hypothetical protein SAMN06269185_3060 [Natronoarchaeum philippinense]|uniref:Uncharacterized protein n=1 Tax=Natronoarchaeum philippinense TaxID=558529 RepID=A0A285P797_NATPI|nr:hypothetical protein [Natronoarchaeum philippinense]SNZ17619.1 hypothetical protein SAMN06269185_3060 [Natronoarchaeum philippinense]